MLDKIFGLAEAAMRLTENRSQILANNISNASTPNYKARDIDFAKILKATHENQMANEIAINGSVSSQHLLYRVPMQTSMDGNTVDDNIERKAFMENSLKYQMALGNIQSKSDEIRKALKGE